MRTIFCCMLCFAVSVITDAQNATKKPKPYFTLLEAYTQRIIPGIAGRPIETNTHFILVWKGDHYPETCCWNGDDGWQACTVVLARKITKQMYNVPQGVDYLTANINPAAIRKGDTLELTTISKHKLPVPPEIPAEAKNTLFFKTGGSGWLSYPVKNIGRKLDI